MFTTFLGVFSTWTLEMINLQKNRNPWTSTLSQRKFIKTSALTHRTGKPFDAQTTCELSAENGGL